MSETNVKLPDMGKYRVVVVGAAYDAPRIDYDMEGKPRVIYVQLVAGRRQEVDLVPREAKRLMDLGAVRPADESMGYDELDDKELAAKAAERGVLVRSSGADPEQPLREDFVNALANADLGEVSGVGVGTLPGGIGVASSDGVTRTDVPQSAVAPVPVFDAATATDAELADYIRVHSLKVEDTVALANGDPAVGERVLAAEKAANDGEPRKGVVSGLEAL